MGLSKSRGSLPPPVPGEPKRCFDVPPIDPKQIQYATVPVNTEPTDAVNAEQYVARSVQDTGVASESDKQMAFLAAYSEGSTITVTFYHQIKTDSYGRSTYESFSESLDPIHQNYLKINNFQMKLKEGVGFNYDQSTTQSQVNGEAVLYPYFCPFKGDMFIYQTNANKLGLFKITEPPQRLSIAGSTCHSIKFILLQWVDAEILEKLKACVVDEATFDLMTFLNGQGTLLTSDEASTIAQVKKAIEVLTHRYIADFLETKVYRTFIENACLYDPYLVEFCRKLFDCKDLPIYPEQLLPNPAFWNECFWSCLLDPEYTPERMMVTKAAKLNKAINYRTTTINALSNRCFILLDNCEIGTYTYPPFTIPKEKEWDKDVVTVPMQVRLYLSQKKVFPSALLELAKQMVTVRRIAAFYFIPIVIFLLKKLLAALTSGDQNLIYHDPDEDKKPDGGCICDCSDCIFSCRPPHFRSMPKCPGHQHHHCSFGKDCNDILLPPCGGCSTDPQPRPMMWRPNTKFILEADYRRYHRDLSKLPPKGIPMYGPGRTPIQCDHPPLPPMDPNQGCVNRVDDIFYYDEETGEIHRVDGVEGLQYVELPDGMYTPEDSVVPQDLDPIP